MKTLKEEREAIVDTIDDIMAKYHMGEHMYSPEREEVVTALLSHEEKVVERVIEMLDEEMEHFADIEHERWSKWQEYMHSKCVEHEKGDGEWVCFPSEFMKRWNRQIATPYAELSEAEKESDREQVRPYLNHIKSKLTVLTLPITDENV